MAKITPNPLRGQIHARIIQSVLDDIPGAKAGGFWKDIKAIEDLDYVNDLLENDPEWTRWVHFVPDAHLIDAEERNIVIYEAVDTSDISERKFAQMVDFSWALDEDYWDLILVRCDSFGRSIFSPRDASIVSMLEGVSGADSYRVPGWQKYTMQYVDGFFGRDAA
jgi:hypothetical protein